MSEGKYVRSDTCPRALSLTITVQEYVLVLYLLMHVGKWPGYEWLTCRQVVDCPSPSTTLNHFHISQAALRLEEDQCTNV